MFIGSAPGDAQKSSIAFTERGLASLARRGWSE
jgi:hypothetical protein